MCGIVGYITTNDNYFQNARRGFFKYALMLDTLRGPESTGVISVSNKFTVNRYRTTASGYRMAASPEFEALPNGWAAIGHNRAATHGAIKVENAHPFHFGRVSLVHNGTLVAKGASLPTFQKNFEVDSMQIGYALSTVKPKEAPDILAKINGDFAVVWVDERDRSINMARNLGRPLHLGWNREKELLVFMSDYAHLMVLTKAFNGTQAAIPNIYSLDSYQLLKWKRGSLAPEVLEFDPFVKPRVRAPAGIYTPPTTQNKAAIGTTSGTHGTPSVEQRNREMTSAAEKAREKWAMRRNQAPDKSKAETDTTQDLKGGRRINRLVSPTIRKVMRQNTGAMLGALLEYFKTTPESLVSFAPGDNYELGNGYNRVYGIVNAEGWGNVDWEGVIPMVNESQAKAFSNQPWLVRAVGLANAKDYGGCPAVLCELVHCDFDKYEKQSAEREYLEGEEKTPSQGNLVQDPEGRLINKWQLQARLDEHGCINCGIELYAEEAWSYKLVNDDKDFLCEKCKWDKEIGDA